MVKICQYEQLQQLQRLLFSRFECRALISHVLSWVHRARERERDNSSILPTLSETFFFFCPVQSGSWRPMATKHFLGGRSAVSGWRFPFFVRLKMGKHWEWCKSNLCSFCLRGENRTCVFVRFCLGGVGWGGLITFIFICTCAHTSRYATAVSFALAHLHKKEQSRLNDLIWRYVRTWQWCWEAMLLDLPKRSLLCQDLSVTG